MRVPERRAIAVMRPKEIQCMRASKIAARSLNVYMQGWIRRVLYLLQNLLIM